MKLVLINPRDTNTCAFSNHLPPLGLGYVAALTPRDWDVVLIDENVEPFVFRKADLVAVSAMTVQAPRAYEICSLYRKAGTAVIVGGMHVSMAPDEAMQYATSVVIGEAEAVWPSVIDDFLAGRLRRVYTGAGLPSLENMVPPRRDLFSRTYRLDAIQTSRGCPFHCEFCTVPLLAGGRTRFRPVEEVVDEMRQTRRRLLAFVDDNIAGPDRMGQERAVALFEGILSSGIKRRWVSQASVLVADNEALLKLMKRCGCAGLLVGFESIDPNRLRNYGKLQNLSGRRLPEDFYLDVIKRFHKHGIGVTGFFCYGYEDTRDSILESLRFIKRSGMDVVNTPIMIPTPGTPFFDRVRQDIELRTYPRDWSLYLGRLVFRPKHTSKKEFYKAYLILIMDVNSLREVLKRTWNCLLWSKSPFEAGVALFTNLMFRRLKIRAVRFLLGTDPDFKQAYEEWRDRSP